MNAPPADKLARLGMLLATAEAAIEEGRAILAAIRPACGVTAPHSGVECVRLPGHDGRHESGHRPAIVWDAGDDTWTQAEWDGLTYEQAYARLTGHFQLPGITARNMLLTALKGQSANFAPYRLTHESGMSREVGYCILRDLWVPATPAASDTTGSAA